jgi:putative peptide zinc metalloprotease protein
VSTHVFNEERLFAEARLIGQEGRNLVLRDVQIVPHDHGTLPARALGFAGGGDVAVLPNDPSGMAAAEPFFRVHASFEASDVRDVRIAHGRLGVMRITLADKPLLEQWTRGARQFLQRRFRV